MGLGKIVSDLQLRLNSKLRINTNEHEYFGLGWCVPRFWEILYVGDSCRELPCRVLDVSH